MNEEILSGLRISLERGFTLDSAVQSFINAGYNSAEVNEAAALIQRGSSPIQAQPSAQIPVQPFPKTPPLSGMPQAKTPPKEILGTKPSVSPKMKLLLVIAIALILLIVAGAIVTLLFKDQILSLFTS
jgi:hypothetical protein